VIQGSEAWFEARRGKVTSSGIAAVLSKGRNGGIPLTRNSYMDDLIAERMLGRTMDSFENEAMRWGSACEAEARTFYALTRDVDVQEVGFKDHPTIPMAGASLDGLVGEDGFVEFKCPTTTTHLETWRKNAVPSLYRRAQIPWEAACYPERKWADFCSYDPRIEDRSKRLFVKRVIIDRAEVGAIEDAVRNFLIEMGPIEERVRAFHRRAAA
jgi:putative phage-type endonuclease